MTQVCSVVLITMRRSLTWWHGWPPSMAEWSTVTVAKPTPRIPLVARRHIDLKRVCSCSCLP
ncbi:Ms4527A family Cys-rich leader peptide [Mycobacterium sp.]|uniref:Ms4527A family Cys-rich leader peptide n=1 Tax=Mycobacterium sp. TaxID=1785 RepID=UPI003C76CE8C